MDVNIYSRVASTLHSAAEWHEENIAAGRGQTMHMAAANSCKYLAERVEEGDANLLEQLVELGDLHGAHLRVARRVGIDFHPRSIDEYLQEVRNAFETAA